MKILVQQVKTALEDFVLGLEGSKEEKTEKWREALGTIWLATRRHNNRKDLDTFDAAWAKCDITYKELAKRLKTTESAIKVALYRVREQIKRELTLL